MGIKTCYNVEEFRDLAKRKLPTAIFDYMDGGADDETTLGRNTSAFDDFDLVPDYLVNVDKIDMSTTVLGAKIDVPFILSPTGGNCLFHPDRELGVARAAAEFGTMMSLSTMASSTIEEIGTATSGPKMYQVYILKDRELSREFVTRAKASNYDAICLTVDSSIAGNRERDLRSGLNFPPSPTIHTFMDFMMHPVWTYNFKVRSNFSLANIAHRVPSDSKMNVFEMAHNLFDTSVDWNDAEWLAKEWGGPFAIKGLQSVADVKRAREVGATCVILSSHGGRQLDGMSAPIDRLAEIRDAIGDDMEIILDSGVRRGSHVVKALALGANAVSFGRPYLYGLAAGGQPGVERVLQLMRDEIERAMGFMGATSIADLSRDQVRHRYRQISRREASIAPIDPARVPPQAASS